MNLQTEISEVRARISEQYPGEQVDAHITDLEIVDWLYAAEVQLLHDLDPHLILDVSGLTEEKGIDILAVNTFVAVPANFVKMIACSIDINNIGSWCPAVLVSFADLLRADQNDNWRATPQFPKIAFFGGNIHFRPKAPANVTSGVKLYQVKMPTRRFKHYRGDITSVTNATTFADSKMIQKGWPDDFFNLGEIKFVGEAGIGGENRSVSDYTGATGTIVTGAGTTTPVAGNEFEIGDLSSFPERLRHPLLTYVTYLALLKDREEDAVKQRSEYSTQIAALNMTASGIAPV